MWPYLISSFIENTPERRKCRDFRIETTKEQDEHRGAAKFLRKRQRKKISHHSSILWEFCEKMTTNIK